jgi:GT2 family glycosyltransferase
MVRTSSGYSGKTFLPSGERPGAVPGGVAVVIVDWNTGELVEGCLTALSRQSVPPSQVVVIDNAGRSETWRHVKAEHPRIDMVRLTRNRGFAAASNLGIALAPDVGWIALLNPDAFPEPEWLENLLAAAKLHPEYSFFASRQVMADDPSLLDGTGDIYAVSGLAWRRDHGQPSAGNRERREEVFGPCAAAALYRRDALTGVGGLDESYFCYFEDVDLAFRLRLRGYRCLYVAEAVVRHVGSAVTGRRSDFSIYHGHRNLVWTFWKNMPAPLLARYWPHHMALNVISLIHFTARGQGKVIVRAKRDALTSIPRILRARRVIQARRKANATELRRVMVAGLQSLGLRRFPTS